uniref:Metallo-beta-lactamase domain-containing protein n=1 Tax=Mycena chlorophos TaxID=658473 RepID=A0ABQ0LCK3_MYCCL|nr:predicted protein [Mycena chlorophos]
MDDSLQSRIAVTPHRPILTSLNGDNSWLYSFPIPPSVRSPGTSKVYYHVAADLWLGGPAGIPWLVNLALTATPTVADGKAVDGVVQEIERAAGNPEADAATLDLLALFFHYTDHMHEPTLRTFDAKIPVLATSEAAATVSGWKHFENLTTSRDFDPLAGQPWTAYHPGAPLPDWLNVVRLKGHHELNFATAIIYSPSPTTNEVIFYSPHGIRTDQASLQTFLASPDLSTLAILHGLKDNWAFGYQTTLGVVGGGWKHFENLTRSRDFDPLAGQPLTAYHPGAPLPDWLSVIRLKGHHELNFATAIIYSPSPTTNEVIFYSPHGIRTDQASLQTFLTSPDLSTLAILHGLKDNWAFGYQTTLGVVGGLALQRLARPRYWVKSHDAPLIYTGLVMFLGRVKDYWKTIDEGLEKEKAEKGAESLGDRPNFVEVEMNQSFVLV